MSPPSRARLVKPLSPTVSLRLGLSLGQGQLPSLRDRQGHGGGGCLPLPPRPENQPQEGSGVSASEVTAVAAVPGVLLLPAVPRCPEVSEVSNDSFNKAPPPESGQSGRSGGFAGLWDSAPWPWCSLQIFPARGWGGLLARSEAPMAAPDLLHGHPLLPKSRRPQVSNRTPWALLGPLRVKTRTAVSWLPGPPVGDLSFGASCLRPPHSPRAAPGL